MKSKIELSVKAFELVQEMITFAEPGSGHDALDAIAMLLQRGSETLASASSVRQAVEGLNTIAIHLRHAKLPAVEFVPAGSVVKANPDTKH